jgi:hypothetical protein
MKRNENRGSLYLITALVLGVSAGLIYGWLISPVRYVNTAPNALRADFKDRYRVLVAQAFLANQDIGRAAARLALVGDVDSVVALTLQAQRAIAEGQPDVEIQALTYLMLALSQGDTPIQLPTQVVPKGLPGLAITFTPTPSATLTTIITPSPVATATPVIHPGENPAASILTPTLTIPTSTTPTATPGIPFVLSERTMVCDPPQSAPSLQIETQSGDGKPIPGVAVTIRQDDQEGEERFFTGLKPEISLGYADFAMLPDINYTIWLGEGGQPIAIESPRCKVGAQETWGILKLLFIQP